MARPVIVHLLPGLGPGGAEALLVTNLENFDRERFEHVVAVVAAERSALFSATHFWEPSVRALGVDVHHLGHHTRRDLVTGIVPFAAWLRARGACVVHTHLLLANLLGSAAGRMAGVSVVRSLHSLSYEPEVLAGYRGGPTARRHEVARQLEGVSARRGCDRVIAVGHTVAKSAANQFGLRPEAIQVVHNPVRRPTDVLPRGEARTLVRTVLNVPASTPVVLSIGRVIPSKAHPVLVRALSLVIRAVPDVHLAIAGSLAHEAGVRAVREAIEAEGLGDRVHLVGTRSDVHHWLRGADVFAFPSVFEGLSVALAEAAVAGCACVVSDIGGNREVVADDSMGIVCPVNDVERLAAGIQRVLQDPGSAERMGAALQAFAIPRFDAARSARTLESVYAELCMRTNTLKDRP